MLEDLDKLASDEYVPGYRRAVIHAALGDNEGAMALLEKAHDERSFLVYTKVDPAFDTLRKEERYVALLDKMSL